MLVSNNCDILKHSYTSMTAGWGGRGVCWTVSASVSAYGYLVFHTAEGGGETHQHRLHHHDDGVGDERLEDGVVERHRCHRQL